MIEEKAQHQPWTVPALVIWSILVTAGVAVKGNSAPAPMIVWLWIPLSLVLKFGAWQTKRPLLTAMFALAVFNALLVLPIRLMFGDGATADVVLPTVAVAGHLFLVLHPATRKYAFVPQNVPGRETSGPDMVAGSRPVAQRPSTPGTESTGMRRNTVIALAFLLGAIAIAGVLGVMRIYEMAG